MSVAFALGLLTLAIWLYLVLGRSFFWTARVAPSPTLAAEAWPRVTAVVPARNEAELVGRAVASLLRQEYRGSLSVVLVDDFSNDGTGELARAAAAEAGRADRLAVVRPRPLPPGWTGKLWAIAEGVRHIEAEGQLPDLLLFTDADIEHHPSNLAELVARLGRERREIASLMVLLRCRSFAERFLVPAFVFFFAMLYPFGWSNDPRRRTAAAAGGCILLRSSTYRRIGGLEAIRGELIDDCALARRVKEGGHSIWLGLTRRTRSLRAYPRVADIWNMVARTAFTQLGYSPLMLAATAAGLVATYLLPVVLIAAGGWAAFFGAVAWALMTIAYLPWVRLYGQNPLWAPLLPAVAVVYLGATLASAWRHWRGRGGQWKGRVQWQSQQ